MIKDIAGIHQFWFGTLDADGFAPPDRQKLWFSAAARTDITIRERFGDLVGRALSGELGSWAQGDQGLIALVLLLDQFTRNIYRGTAKAFAGDPQALALARGAISARRHLALPAIHRVFLYLPLEHCEDLTTQEQCVHLYTELEQEAGAARTGSFTRYAGAHRDVIARFGRFPHRNAILGRTSSPEELAYLAQHSGF